MACMGVQTNIKYQDQQHQYARIRHIYRVLVFLQFSDLPYATHWSPDTFQMNLEYNTLKEWHEGIY